QYTECYSSTREYLTALWSVGPECPRHLLSGGQARETMARVSRRNSRGRSVRRVGSVRSWHLGQRSVVAGGRSSTDSRSCCSPARPSRVLGEDWTPCRRTLRQSSLALL